MPSPQPCLFVHRLPSSMDSRLLQGLCVTVPAYTLYMNYRPYTYIESLALAKGWQMTDVHLGRRSQPGLLQRNPPSTQGNNEICKALFPSGQISSAGWRDEVIAPKFTHCTSCISTPLDPSLDFLGQAHHDEDLFLL